MVSSRLSAVRDNVLRWPTWSRTSGILKSDGEPYCKHTHADDAVGGVCERMIQEVMCLSPGSGDHGRADRAEPAWSWVGWSGMQGYARCTTGQRHAGQSRHMFSSQAPEVTVTSPPYRDPDCRKPTYMTQARSNEMAAEGDDTIKKKTSARNCTRQQFC